MVIYSTGYFLTFLGKILDMS